MEVEKKLGFGLMRLPLLDPTDESSVDLEETKKMIDAFLAEGFTYFDTAWMYCGFQSECIAREALVERHPRDRFTLTTKLHSAFLKERSDRDRIFQEQLRKTGVSYFDYYFLHDINAHSLKIYEKFDCFSWIRQQKELGLTRHIGFSYHDGPELLDQVLTEHPEFEVVQLQINYLDWESTAIRSRECYEVAVKHGKSVIVMEPVKGGTLADIPAEAAALLQDFHPDMSIASWAIRFAASLENVKVVLSGMSTMEQLQDNMNFMSAFQPLSPAEYARIADVVEIIQSGIAIPCTGCSYCTDGCPMQIAIPRYFSLYNADKQEIATKTYTPQGQYYRNLNLKFGKASECIRCGQCESVCPQHLSIIEYLRQVAEHFE